jgi:hypothetical protein
VRLNLITVCTGYYPADYAIKLLKRFKELSNLDIIPYCITDKEYELKDHYVIIEPPEITESWWNKMFIYSNHMPKGWNLYLDLDLVLCKNFDTELEWAVKQDRDITSISDAINWLGVRYNSSFLLLKSGTTQHIYEEWLKTKDELIEYEGGDQVWTGRYLDSIQTDVHYLDDVFDIKRNFKHNLCKVVGEKILVPEVLSENTKIIDCSGFPKPHELKTVPYIKEFWHDVK